MNQRSNLASVAARSGSGGARSAASPLAAQSGIINIEPNAAMIAALGPAPKLEPLGPPKPGDVRSLEEFIAATHSGDLTRANAAVRLMTRQPDPSSPFVLGTDGTMDVDGFAEFALNRTQLISPDAQFLELDPLSAQQLCLRQHSFYRFVGQIRRIAICTKDTLNKYFDSSPRAFA